MGMPSPTNRIVPNLCYGFEGSDSELYSEDNPDWEAKIWNEEVIEDLDNPNDLGNGWTVTKRDWYTGEITKNDMIIQFTNVSQYENVGEVEAAYISDNLEHLQQFQRDFELAPTTFQNETILEWA